jgi:hypothetical protein
MEVMVMKNQVGVLPHPAMLTVKIIIKPFSNSFQILFSAPDCVETFVYQATPREFFTVNWYAKSNFHLYNLCF